MLKKCLLILLFSTSVFSIHAQWLAGYTYRKKITTDNTKVCGASDFTNFPILVNVTDVDLKTTGNGGHVENVSGYDIAFTSSDGTTALTYQIEKYVATTGEYVVWVKIPTLATASNQDIYMYYGNSSIVTDPSSTGTWDGNYKGVWHLPNGTTLTASDNTSNGNNGTLVSTPAAATGKVDGGADFNGSTNYISIANESNFDFEYNQPFTVEAWINPDNFAAVNVKDMGIVGKMANNGTTYRGWDFEVGGYGASWKKLNIYFISNWATSSYIAVYGSTTLVTGTWYHVAMTYSGSGVASGIKFYVNGVLETNTVSTDALASGTILNNANVNIATRDVDLANTFDMKTDEVRISNVVRSADWVCTEHNNQNSPSTFYTFDQEECNGTAVGGTATATDASVAYGASTTITLTGYTGTIQWQSSTNALTYTDIGGETGATYNTGALTATKYYRAKVTNGGSCSVFSTVASVSVIQTVAYSQVIAGGAYHSLALCSDGTVQSWGRNGFVGGPGGELGEGTTTSRSTPGALSNLTGITALAAGWYHSMMRKSDGTIWNCGQNQSGPLGDNTETYRTTAVQASGVTGITQISGGEYHSLTRKSDGTVWAWGANTNGATGDGTTTSPRLTLVQASGLTGITRVSAGRFHSLALKNDGTVWAWGKNTESELGDASTTTRTSPIQVHGVGDVGFLTGMSSIAAGAFHCLALKSDGTVWAWGYNGGGQLGDGTTTLRSTPVQVSGLTDVAVISAGAQTSYALKVDGTVWAWGENDGGGANGGYIGDNTTTDRLTPVQVHGPGDVGFLTGITAIGAGAFHCLALKNDGTVWAWGYNSNGQLGDASTTDRQVPVQASGLCTVTLPLPIELLSFDATVENNNTVKINWATSTEVNNDYFTIERGTVGTGRGTNELQAAPIVTVKGAGNSSRVLNYTVYDDKPLRGISYYRLKQTDFDGKYKYFNWAAVEIKDEFTFNVYPNPAFSGSGVYFDLNSTADNKPVLVIVNDITGREVFSKILITDKGDGKVAAIDPSHTLAAGVYIISATSDNSIYKQRLIIK